MLAPSEQYRSCSLSVKGVTATPGAVYIRSMSSSQAWPDLLERLQLLLLRSGKSQGQISRAARIDRSHLSEIFSGKKKPGVDALLRLIAALDANVDNLLGTRKAVPPSVRGSGPAWQSAGQAMTPLLTKQLIFDKQSRVRALAAIEEPFYVPQQWIDELGQQLSEPGRLAFVSVPPDGITAWMPRTIRAGASLVVDTGPGGSGISEEEFIDGGIYLLRHGPTLECRRVWCYEDESCKALICVSDNTSVAPLLIHLGEEPWRKHLLGLIVKITSDLRPKKSTKVQRTGTPAA